MSNSIIMSDGLALNIGDIVTPVNYEVDNLAIITHWDHKSEYIVRVFYLNSEKSFYTTNGFSRNAKLRLFAKSSKLMRLLFL
jgi:hypothetical protein